METILRQQERPDVSMEQRRSSELVKRIRKLRWMGLEGEAERVENSAHQHFAHGLCTSRPHQMD
jgi:poly-beta-hydroxyalkanoate depolymerase